MSAHEVYVMQDTDDEWVQPTPVGTAVSEVLVRETELETTDIDRLDRYVDVDDIETVLDTDERKQIHVEIEGHDVTIHESGDINLEE